MRQSERQELKKQGSSVQSRAADRNKPILVSLYTNTEYLNAWGVLSYIKFGTSVLDDYHMANNSGTETEITIPRTGYYLISWDTTGTATFQDPPGYLQYEIVVNGTAFGTFPLLQTRNITAAAMAITAFSHHLSIPYFFNSGDKLKFTIIPYDAYALPTPTPFASVRTKPQFLHIELLR